MCLKCHSKPKDEKTIPMIEENKIVERLHPQSSIENNLQYKKSDSNNNGKSTNNIIVIQVNEKKKDNSNGPILNTKQIEIKKKNLESISLKQEIFCNISKPIILSDDIVHNKDHCEQYYFLKSIKTNKTKIKKSCAICLHYTFDPTELVRFKAIEEFYKYLYYCYNSEKRILCYNTLIFNKNKTEFNKYFTNIMKQDNTILFYKSIALCKMCIMKALNSLLSLKHLREKLLLRNQKEKEKIQNQKSKERQQQCITQQKLGETNTTINSNSMNLNESHLEAHQPEKGSHKEKSTNPKNHNSQIPLCPSSSTTNQQDKFLPPLSSNISNKVTNCSYQSLSNKSVTYYTKQEEYSSQFGNETTCNAQKNKQFQRPSGNPMLSTIPLSSSLKTNLITYEDICLSIQQIINTLNIAITDLFVNLSLLLKTNSENYFSAFITNLEEEISGKVKKAYNTIVQLDTFLDKQKKLIEIIHLNLEKLKVISFDHEELNAIEKKVNEEYVKYKDNCEKYKSIIKEYFSKFELTLESLKKQKELIAKYSSFKLMIINKEH